MTQSEWQVCGVCGYPLEYLDGVWLHIRSADQDHVVVPVDLSSLDHVNQRCDICSRDGVTDIAITHPFDFPEVGPPQRSIGHWALCETCAGFTRRRRISQLVTRVRTNAPSGWVPPRAYFTEMYERLMRNIIEIISLDEWVARGGFGRVDVDESDTDQTTKPPAPEGDDGSNQT